MRKEFEEYREEEALRDQNALKGFMNLQKIITRNINRIAENEKLLMEDEKRDAIELTQVVSTEQTPGQILVAENIAARDARKAKRKGER